MSLILDALNRSQRERGEAGPVAAPPALGAAAPEQPRSPLVPVLALGLVCACVLSGWLLWERLADDAAPAPATTATPPPASPAPAATATPAQPPPAAAPAVAGAAVSAGASAGSADAGGPPPMARTSDPAVAALYAAAARGGDAAAPPPGAPLEEPGSSSVAGETAAAATAAAATAAADTAAAATAAGGTAAAELSEEPVDVEAVLEAAQREIGARGLAPHPVPLLATLSQQQKDAIPTLMYLRHDYAGPGRSSVLLNRRTLREGDSVDGVRVQEILPDSVVLEHRGTLFRLRALNSWVNL
jgi:hypothetical protein